MLPAAYRRARRLTQSRSGSLWLGHILSAFQAICLIKLLCVGGLLLALCETGGTLRLDDAQFASIQASKSPRWIYDRLPPDASKPLTNVGLGAISWSNRENADRLHRWGASLLGRAVSAFPVLRDNTSALELLLAVGLLLTLGAAYSGFWRRSLSSTAAGAGTNSLRMQIHRQIYRLGQASLPGEGTGPAVDLFTREVNDFRDGVIAEVDHLIRAPLLAFGLLLVGLFVSWPITIFLVALAGLAILTSRPISAGIRREADAAARDSAVRLLLLQEDLAMLRTVRVYGMEEVDRARFEDHLTRFQNDDHRRIRAEARLMPAVWLVYGVAAALAYGLLAFLVLTNKLSLTSSVLLAGVAVALSRPIFQWIRLRNSLRLADRASDAIFRFMERKPELQQTVGAQFLAPLKKGIKFENVSLEGPNGRPLLANVQVEIPAKTRTAVLSLDESSKYAIACLIPRLIDPKQGKVRMDGHDLKEVTLESLRAQVATVLQSDLIFNDTVFANIGLGDTSFGLPRIIEAAKTAHAHHLIQDLPHGYDTPIGTLGHYLPLDAQYRIALARAFLHDPSIVVIEEPTEAMDEDTKHMVDDSIDRLAMDRTLIFLPHRLSTIRKCDHVVVLHNGKVDAAGTPKEVHAASKLYRHIQYVEFNQFATGEIEAGQMG